MILKPRGEEWLVQTGGELKWVKYSFRRAREHAKCCLHIFPVAQHFHTFLSLFFFNQCTFSVNMFVICSLITACFFYVNNTYLAHAF